MSQIVVRSIHPEGLHGFRRGQLMLEGLEDGLNVVFAPNATGKSTLAKAIGLLLNPQKCGEAILNGTVAFEGQEAPLTVRRRDPAFPGAPERPEDYQLDIVRLLSGLDASERDALGRLVGSGLNLTPGSLPVVPSSQVRPAIEARRDLAKARQEASQALEDEDRLPRLQSEKEAAEAAARSCQVLREWLSYREAERSSATLRAEIDALLAEHSGIECQTEGAPATAKALSDAFDAAERTVEDLARQLLRSHPEGRKPLRPLTDVERTTLTTGAADLASAEQTLRTAESEWRKQAESLRASLDDLLRIVDDAELALLRGATREDFRALADAAQEADRRREAESRLKGLQNARDDWRSRFPEEAAELDDTLHLLRQWLEEAPSVPEATAGPSRLLIVAVVGIAAVAAIPDLFGRIVAALIAIAAAFLLNRPLAKEAPLSRRPELASRAKLPADANTEAVVQRLTHLLESRAKREVARELDALTKTELPDFRWAEVAAKLRLAADDPYRLASVAKATERYLYESATAAARRADWEIARDHAEAGRALVSRQLAAFAFPHDASQPGLAIQDFFEWFRRAESHDRAVAELEHRRSEWTEFLDAVGVPSHSETTERTQALLDRVPHAQRLRDLTGRWEQAQRTLKENSPDVHAARVALGREPEFALAEDFEDAIARHAEKAETRDTIIEQIAQCRTRIERIEREAALARAEAAYGREMRQVEARWHGLAQSAVRHRILVHLTERMRTVELPDIVRNANRWVESFTSDRYRLTLGRSGTRQKDELGVLSVQDTHTGREHSFTELSTGTRVHVVLALRLGLIERHEQQASGGTRRFPLLADEVMAVSDPDASQALALALAEIATTRQVIVFTNQPDDVRIFRRLASGCNELTLTSVEPVVDESPMLPLVAYRRPMGSLRFDLRLPVRSHAPAAILPIEISYDAESPTVAELRDEALTPFLETLERLRQDVVRDYPRIEWEKIARQDWVTDTFAERMRQICDEVWGDGKRFLAVLDRTPHRRKSTIEAAERWLMENGYLTPAPSEEEIRRRASEFADPFQREHAVRLLVSAFEA